MSIIEGTLKGGQARRRRGAGKADFQMAQF